MHDAELTRFLHNLQDSREIQATSFYTCQNFKRLRSQYIQYSSIPC